jgi:hypothetical protein
MPKENPKMTPEQNEQYLRSIARDVRLLSYRAGAPNPLGLWIFLAICAPILFIGAVTLIIETGIQFHFIQPVPKPATHVDTYWQSVPLLLPTKQAPKSHSTRSTDNHR